MLSLLSIEWLKIKRYRTFWILSAMFIVLLFLCNWLYSTGIMKLGGPANQILNSNYTFPNVWDNVTYFTKLFSGLLAIIITIITTNEYQFRTNRQNVIDGWKREQFFQAKWLMVLCMSITVTLYSFLLGMFFGLYNGSPVSGATEHMVKLGYVFILTMNYFGFALTLSFLIKRSGMTIISFLLYAYVIEGIAYQVLKWKVNQHAGDFLPMESAANLITFPVMDMARKMMNNEPLASSTLVGMSVCWTIVYYIFGRIRLLKSDW